MAEFSFFGKTIPLIQFPSLYY